MQLGVTPIARYFAAAIEDITLEEIVTDGRTHSRCER
jgi:hypothetical protein